MLWSRSDAFIVLTLSHRMQLLTQLESAELGFTIAFTVEFALWCIACGFLLPEPAAGHQVACFFTTLPQGVINAGKWLFRSLVRWYNAVVPKRSRFDVPTAPRPEYMVLRPAYLQLHWNILDFVVVVTSWPSLYAGSGSTFGVLRLLRLLKPLRTIKMIPGMQMLVEVCFAIAEPQAWVFLLAAVSPAALESTQLTTSALRASANWCRPAAASVPVSATLYRIPCVLQFVCFWAAGPLMLLWAETLNGRCVQYNASSGLTLEDQAQLVAEAQAGEYFERLCSLYDRKNPGRTCPDALTCADSGTMPSYGQRGFDSMSVAMLTFIQVVTLDDWTKIMYQLWDGNNALVILPIVPITLATAYAMLAVSLTVVTIQVSRRLQGQERTRKNEEHLEQKRKEDVIQRVRTYSLVGRTQSGRRLDLYGRTSLQWNMFLHDLKEQFQKAAAMHPLQGPPRSEERDWAGIRWRLFRVISAPRRPLTEAEELSEVLPPEAEAERLRISYFDRCMLVLIIANAAMLGVQYHGMPQSTVNALEDVRSLRRARRSAPLLAR